jgi:putative hydrolase of the HAD superfamily
MTLPMPDWARIRTVFLDMDGTLLDLNFDNHFWLEHLPLRYADRHGISVREAKDALYPRFKAVEGTLAWYCLDHWSRELGLDIVALKHEVAHLIDVHTHVPEFLDALRRAGKRTVLLTNAHGASVALKLDYTGIEGHFDRVITSHALGMAKEEPGFWAKLNSVEPYDPAATLMVDDNLSVLGAARDYGVGYLLAIRKPDRQRGPRETGDYPAIDAFDEVLDGIEAVAG